MNKRKIAYIGIKGLPSRGGAERVVENLVENLSNDYNITVYGIKKYATNQFEYEEIKIINLPMLPIKNIGMVIFLIQCAFHAIICCNYDIIHIHNIDCSFILPILRLKYQNIISTSHGRPQDRDKWSNLTKMLFKIMEKVFFTFSGIITSVSEPLACDYKQKTKKNIFYIPNGINKDEFIDMTGAKKILTDNKVNKDFILFAAGRVIPTKGCHTLLEALEIIKYRGICVIAGDLKQLHKYSKKLKAMSKDLNVKFLGFISSKEVLLGLIKKAKLFVFPSTIEAMSMMILEVASVSTPTICSDIPENTSILRSDHTIFFKTGDSNDLASKLEWALNNPDELKKKAHNCIRWVQSEYDWKTISLQYKNLYENIIKLK